MQKKAKAEALANALKQAEVVKMVELEANTLASNRRLSDVVERNKEISKSARKRSTEAIKNLEEELEDFTSGVSTTYMSLPSNQISN